MLDANPGANDDLNHDIEDLEPASIDTDDIDGNELDDADDSGARYEHFRFVADKGQALLRVDKFPDSSFTPDMVITMAPSLTLSLGISATTPTSMSPTPVWAWYIVSTKTPPDSLL